MDMIEVSRSSFNLEDLLTVITSKETLIRIFYDDKEIDYMKSADYKDYYVYDLGIGEENGKPCINVKLTESVSFVYTPYIQPYLN